MPRQTKAQKQAEREARMARLTAAHNLVKTGACPICGTKLYRNNSMTGWWQCGHFGAEGFQKEAGAHCDFQIFYPAPPEEHAAILVREGK